MIHKRKLVCMTAAGFLGILLTTATVSPAFGQSRVVIEAPRIDPTLQRRVYYGDLNLATSRHQRVLKNRIFVTAKKLCFDVNLVKEESCPTNAVRSTTGQVAAAIERAELRMAGQRAGPDVAITMAITGL